MSILTPAQDRLAFTVEEIAGLDAIAANRTSYGSGDDDYAKIDPFGGVHPMILKPENSARPWAILELKVFHSDEREKGTDKNGKKIAMDGDERAQAIAEDAKELLGYDVAVWLIIGAAPHFGETMPKSKPKDA